MLWAQLSDRRRYPRVQADVICRLAGADLLHHHRNSHNISLGGMRVFSDEEFAKGRKLDLDVLLPDGSALRCWAVVVWSTRLPDGSPAKFDIGLRFTDMAADDIQRLASVLVSAD